MVTNLNLSYSQAFGLLKNHHFHPHPSLRWGIRSMWPKKGFGMCQDTAPSERLEVPITVTPHVTGALRPSQMLLGSPHHCVFIIHNSEAFCAWSLPLYYLPFLQGSLSFFH